MAERKAAGVGFEPTGDLSAACGFQDHFEAPNLQGNFWLFASLFASRGLWAAGDSACPSRTLRLETSRLSSTTRADIAR
jgi:hypothetical protein